MQTINYWLTCGHRREFLGQGAWVNILQNAYVGKISFFGEIWKNKDLKGTSFLITFDTSFKDLTNVLKMVSFTYWKSKF